MPYIGGLTRLNVGIEMQKMSVTEARAFIREVQARIPETRESNGISALCDAYEDMAEPEKAKLNASLWALFEHGEAGERAISLSFWGARGMPLEVADGLAEAYLAKPEQRLGSTIGNGLFIEFSDSVMDRLAALFVANPMEHLDILPSVLRARPRGATWGVLLALTAQAQNAIQLYDLYNGVTAERKREWFARLRGRPAEVLAEFKSYIGRDSERLLDEVLAADED